MSKTKKCLSGIVLLLIITNSCITDPNEKENQIFHNISAAEAYQLIEENKNNVEFMTIDVRTEAEFEQQHIQNAVNIDYYSPDFKERLDALDKNKIYLVYCRSGHRSDNTLNKMKKLGFQEVYNLSGGITSWIEQGYPLVEKCPICSIENNVKLA